MAAPLDARLTGILEAAVARLIPDDELGIGAREAGVAVYVARTLEEHDVHLIEMYARGLVALDGRARAVYGAGFDELGADAQDSTLTALERGEIDADVAGAAFFELLLRHTREGMFGDPRWGGNAGGAGWSLLGYPGPRAEWTAADQALAEPA